MSQTFSPPLVPPPAAAVPTQDLKEEYEYATEEYYEEELEKTKPKPQIRAQALEPEEIMATPAQLNGTMSDKKGPSLDPYNKFLKWTDEQSKKSVGTPDASQN